LRFAGVREEEKTRLRKLRDAASDVGKSVLAGAILLAGKAVAGGY
jgi:hypothetical protein